MKGYEGAIILLALILVSGNVSAQYWFQTGARAGQDATNNNGAGISIETVQQSQQIGSFAFWVGETLQNGAFLQVGYVVENQSGEYPSFCNNAGCSGYEHITAGDAEWFYEYFPANNASTFLGAIGPDGSAGKNGTFNNYAFEYKGDKWVFLFNGDQIGSVNLDTGSSGQQAPVAFAELANTTTSSETMSDVIFTNFTMYKDGAFLQVPHGYSYVGYGVDSDKGLQNPYGVNEVGSRVDYYEVGSGLQRPVNNTQLWSVGYSLAIISPYANISGTAQYQAYSAVSIYAPSVLYINNSARIVFEGWNGNGDGAYTGKSNSAVVTLYANTTETADWQLQYYLNVSSAYGTANGSGWYPANSAENYSLSEGLIYESNFSRTVFDRWTGGGTALNGSVYLDRPVSITADWEQEYLAQITSQYGNATGSGWYAKGSNATFSVVTPIAQQNSTQRLAFYSWSNGYTNSTMHVTVTQPVILNAMYRYQYLVRFQGQNVDGTDVGPVQFYVNGNVVANPAYLYSGVNYIITAASYSGSEMQLNDSFTADAPANETVQLPLYSIVIDTKDIFGIPVNAMTQVTLPNGTTESINSGATGAVELNNIPYGRVTGDSRYLGLEEPIESMDGSPIDAIFLSGTDATALGVLVILSGILYLVLGRRHDRLGNQGYQTKG